MADHVTRAGLRVATPLAGFVETRALPGSGVDTARFWAGFAALLARFAPENRALLDRRDTLQAALDAWHRQRRGQPPDSAAEEAFLRAIGYLVPEPPAATIDTAGVDPEIAVMAGPQLVVPVLNDRFVLNAANARWGSLYDALYGTDALPDQAPATGPGYDPVRGAAVIAWAKAFLDQALPLAAGSHATITGWRVDGGRALALHGTDAWALAEPGAFVGYRGPVAAPTGLLFRHHGLHIELVIDPAHPVGRQDPAGLADVVLEAALTTIVDLEDSIAAVDAADKVAAYANWLGLMQGTLTARFEKGGRLRHRALAADRPWAAPDGTALVLPGRSLLLVRNVGLLMTTPMLHLADGTEAPEGIVDAVITSLIALHDLRRTGPLANSRTGAVYIVKPKLHGPDEAAFTDRLFDAVEDLLGLARYTVKIGVMDEERRTSANLAATIAQVRHRLAFINTGFLDRTGDEIHSAMQAGAVVPKAAMKATAWIDAYEKRNVAIGLAWGLAGRAQIGKGMWAAPDRMADMLAQKIGHPQAGANTAWVPSPTAATLHALHYHAVDVFARQSALRDQPVPPVAALLTLPLAAGAPWPAETVARELDNNAQGILGYVVRWIDQGIGCSKVPDIDDVGLMEDRATLRISSQHLANWLLHGVCTAADVDAALLRMAAKVDAQNAADPAYRPMAPAPDASLAFQAARALVFAATAQPNGYTEPLLHAFRARVKAAALSSSA